MWAGTARLRSTISTSRPFVFQGTIVDVVIEAFGEEVMDYEVLMEELMGSQ